MKFTSFTTFTTLLLAAFSSVTVSASPVATLEKRDVFTPPVLYPHNGTVWKIGQHHNVTWDTSNAPAELSNPVGLILLRKAGETTPVILANNFSILLGRIEVTVPWVVDGADYSIILFGDSGNDSQDFTITGSGIEF
jgi:hypothetical protein